MTVVCSQENVEQQTDLFYHQQLRICIKVCFLRKDKCINKPLSIEEKLDILISDNDFNKDGFVKTEDLDYDLNNRYDADGNVYSSVALTLSARANSTSSGQERKFTLHQYHKLQE